MQQKTQQPELLSSYLSFNNCKCVLSRKVVPNLTQTWNMWLKLSRSSISTKTFDYFDSAHATTRTCIGNLTTWGYPSWSWSKCHNVIMFPQCGPTPGLRQGSQRFLEAHPPWLGDLSNAQLCATIQPHVTCLQVDPFWDTRLRFRMYTVFRASVWRVSRKFTRHQLLSFQKTSMSDNPNLSCSYVSKRCWTTCFKQDFSCVLWVPNSERHCDSLFTEVGSLFKTRTDEKVCNIFCKGRRTYLINGTSNYSKWHLMENHHL